MRAGRGRVRPPLPFHPPRRCSTVGGGVLAPRPRDLGEGGGGTAGASGRRAPSSRGAAGGGGAGAGAGAFETAAAPVGAGRDPQLGGDAGACREWGEPRPCVPPPCQPLGGSGGRCVRAKACAERRARVPPGSAAAPVGSGAVAAGSVLGQDVARRAAAPGPWGRFRAARAFAGNCAAGPPAPPRARLCDGAGERCTGRGSARCQAAQVPASLWGHPDQGAQGPSRGFALGDLHKRAGHGPGQPIVGGPDREGGWRSWF